MARVKFACICDRCNTRGPEYEFFAFCEICDGELCETCMPGHDEETMKGVCSTCKEEAFPFARKPGESAEAWAERMAREVVLSGPYKGLSKMEAILLEGAAG